MAELNVKFQTQEKELQISKLEQEKLAHQAFLLKASVCVGCLLVIVLIVILTLHYKNEWQKERSNCFSRKMS